jgi:hypothetical protein
VTHIELLTATKLAVGVLRTKLQTLSSGLRETCVALLLKMSSSDDNVTRFSWFVCSLVIMRYFAECARNKCV